MRNDKIGTCSSREGFRFVGKTVWTILEENYRRCTNDCLECRREGRKEIRSNICAHEENRERDTIGTKRKGECGDATWTKGKEWWNGVEGGEGTEGCVERGISERAMGLKGALGSSGLGDCRALSSSGV